MPDDWGEDDYYYYDQDQEDEDAPITIPTVEPDADARLELAKDRSHALSAQEVYRKVSGAVVTVAVDLDGGRMSVGTGVIFRQDGYILTNHHVVAGGKTCTVLLPGGGEELTVDSRLCVAETVIVGQVPQTWFQTGGLPADT